MQGTGTYKGTYPIRRIAKAEQGIHMPIGLTGTFSIYHNETTGVITLVPQER